MAFFVLFQHQCNRGPHISLILGLSVSLYTNCGSVFTRLMQICAVVTKTKLQCMEKNRAEKRMVIQDRIYHT